jgi:hypothetical protein
MRGVKPRLGQLSSETTGVYPPPASGVPPLGATPLTDTFPQFAHPDPPSSD